MSPKCYNYPVLCVLSIVGGGGRGGYHEYRGDVQYRGGRIMINVGDILSTMGVLSTVRGYHEYRGKLS